MSIEMSEWTTQIHLFDFNYTCDKKPTNLNTLRRSQQTHHMSCGQQLWSTYKLTHTQIQVIVISTNLDACFGQFQLHCQMLPREDIRILALVERLLQLVQLICRKGRPRSACVWWKWVQILYTRVGRISLRCATFADRWTVRFAIGAMAQQCLPSDFSRSLVRILFDTVVTVVVIAFHVDALLFVISMRHQTDGSFFVCRIMAETSLEYTHHLRNNSRNMFEFEYRLHTRAWHFQRIHGLARWIRKNSLVTCNDPCNGFVRHASPAGKNMFEFACG